MIEKQPVLKQGWLRALVFLITFLAMNFLMVFAFGGLVKSAGQNGTDSLQGMALVYILGSAVIACITVIVFRRLVDRKSFKSLGLDWTNNGAHAATGFFLAMLLLGTGSLVLMAVGNLHWADLQFDANELFLGCGLMAIIAFAEELVFRGYILNNLQQSMNKWAALIISAVLFALFHRSNSGMNVLPFINILLGGILLGVNYIYTRNLWFSILFHFSWNFYQGSVLGYKVSGLQIKSVLGQDLTGNNLLTGGNFGFEGSIVSTLLLLVAAGSLVWVYENKYSTVKTDMLAKS